MSKKPIARFFKLVSDRGVLLKFESEQHHLDFLHENIDLGSLSKKLQDKLKLEIINLNKISSINHCFLEKQPNHHCVEMVLNNDQVYYISCYDQDRLKEWLSYIKKGMHSHEWVSGLKEFMERNKSKLTEKMCMKLSEIIQFVDQYSFIEKIEIPFVGKE